MLDPRAPLGAAVLALLVACAHAAEPKPAPAPPPATTSAAPLFDDLGTYHRPITTASPVAQQYFDQGLRLIYGFNHDEAKRAFEAGVQADPACAMCYWGIAETLGTNYNLPGDEERDRLGRDAAKRAASLAGSGTPAERDLIAAVAKRYEGAPAVDRAARDRAYADAMREASRRHPEDLDVATLYAEAMMNLRPWDLWTHDGKPQPGTVEIVETLESVIARDPQHPGAHHYYIHAVEASPRPERGLASAAALPSLMPGAGHLVHMPSHIYMRVGQYENAAEANEKAIAVDDAYIAKAKPEGVYPAMYATHNVHFLWAAASMEGRSAEALEAAQGVVAKVPPAAVQHMPGLEAFTPTLLLAQVRFGRWDEILAAPAPPADLPYTTGLWHFARGLADTRKGRLAEADVELAELRRILAETPPERDLMDQNLASTRLSIASDVLEGEIAAARGRMREAVSLLQKAVKTEDGLTYTEPPPWPLPVRQTLGAVLLKAGRPREAEAVYREDLAVYPENGWALIGLAQSLRAQGKRREADEVQARFERAWAKADVTIASSRL